MVETPAFTGLRVSIVERSLPSFNLVSPPPLQWRRKRRRRCELHVVHVPGVLRAGSGVFVAWWKCTRELATTGRERVETRLEPAMQKSTSPAKTQSWPSLHFTFYALLEVTAQCSPPVDIDSVQRDRHSHEEHVVVRWHVRRRGANWKVIVLDN